MGAAADEIDHQIVETRDHIDENLGLLERRAASNAVRYVRVSAMVLGVVVVACAGVLIYRRINRPSRRERLPRMVIQALKDFPDSLRDLPDEVTSRLKRPLPSIKVEMNDAGVSQEPGTLETIARKVAPAIVTTAPGALIDRFTRQDPLSEKTTVPAVD